MERPADDSMPMDLTFGKGLLQDADWHQGCGASGEPRDRQHRLLH